MCLACLALHILVHTEDVLNRSYRTSSLIRGDTSSRRTQFIQGDDIPLASNPKNGVEDFSDPQKMTIQIVCLIKYKYDVKSI